MIKLGIIWCMVWGILFCVTRVVEAQGIPRPSWEERLIRPTQGSCGEPVLEHSKRFEVEDGRVVWVLGIRRACDPKIAPCPYHRYFMRSLDSGCTWESIRFDEITEISGGDPAYGFFTRHRGLIGGGQIGGLLSTSDGGYTWDIVAFPRPTSSIFVLDSKRAWIYGEGDGVYAGPPFRLWKTTDAGMTWTEVLRDEAANYFGLPQEEYEKKFTWEFGRKLRDRLIQDPTLKLGHFTVPPGAPKPNPPKEIKAPQ